MSMYMKWTAGWWSGQLSVKGIILYLLGGFNVKKKWKYHIIKLGQIIL